MGQRVRETERKYEAADDSGPPPGPPDLEGLPAVARTRTPGPDLLDAVYYDTADLTLAAHRTTLRRRTGGDDEGWHLKLPTAEPDTRTEVRVPLGRSTVTPPKALRTEVTALLRGRPLAPVVRLRTTRNRVLLLDAGGRALAEIAYDEVAAYDPASGVSGTSGDGVGEPTVVWTETEVELRRGGADLLDAVEERLKAAGQQRSTSRSKLARALGDRLAEPEEPAGAPTTAGEVAAGYLRRQLAALLALDPLVRRDQEDAVHRMRVATRRARSAFKSFRRQLDPAVTAPLGEELRWLAGVLGTARDSEVLTTRIDGLIAGLDADVRARLVTPALRARLDAMAADSHQQTHAAVVRILGRSHYFLVLDGLEALLAVPPYLPAAAAPAPEAAAAVVRRDHVRLRRQIEAALALPPGGDRNTALHEARKSAKRARYSSEAAEPVLGAPAAAHVGRMKGVQTLLGEHQDSVICRVALDRIGQQAEAAGESGFAYGVLAQIERERAAAIEARLPEAWRAADRVL